MPANLENLAMATGLEKVSFHSNPKDVPKECSNYSCASKAMLKILQARLWQSVNHAKMGSIKNRNGMDLTEAEDIKKRLQEHTEGLCKKRSSQPR